MVLQRLMIFIPAYCLKKKEVLESIGMLLKTFVSPLVEVNWSHQTSPNTIARSSLFKIQVKNIGSVFGVKFELPPQEVSGRDM